MRSLVKSADAEHDVGLLANRDVLEGSLPVYG